MRKETKEKNAEISARIRKVIDDLHISPNAFALKLNYKRGQTIYDILNEKCAPSYDFFNRFMLSEFSETYSVDWLLTGRGSMYLPHIGTALELGEKNILQQIVKGSDKQIVYATDFQSSALLKAFEQIGEQLSSMSDMTNTVKEIAKLNGELASKAVLCDSYLEKIVSQAEEIGQLREQIEQLKNRLQKNADAVNIDTTANAG